MVEFLPRSAWNARPARGGPGNLTVSRVEGVAIHWPGMGSRRLDTRAEVASALRGWQDFHMDDKDWSDIAYQVAVDQAGRAWDLRGLRTQSGANGSADVNERYGALLLVVGSGEQPTPEMIEATREVIRDFRALYPNGDAIKPHSSVRPDGTDCPGDIVRDLIARGAFVPGASSNDQEDDMPTPKEIEDATYRGTLRALREYGAALFKDEQGTADTIWDEVREHRKAELAALQGIERNTGAGS